MIFSLMILGEKNGVIHFFQKTHVQGCKVLYDIFVNGFGVILSQNVWMDCRSS